MIKKIPVGDLRVGMYVSDFNSGWLDHPFLRNSMLISSDEELERVVRAGIRELYIDTEQGLDVGGNAPTLEEARRQTQAAVEQVASDVAAAGIRRPEARVSLAEEMARSRAAFSEATRIIRGLMDDARLGRQVQIASARPTVEKITASVMRNSNAMLTMRRLKSLDDYIFLHSVSVCAMLVTFAKVLEMDLGTIHDSGLGGLIHDLGHMRVASAIRSKPGRLSEEEYIHVRSHVVLGSDLVRQLPGVPALALEVLEMHHERFDGSGYPKGLKGGEISQVGRMAAIVDVYDAITSDRVYRKGMSPAAAIQKMFEWSRFHFDPELMQAFLRSVGIYPVGTLVRLESGRLGIVIEQHDTQLLTPKVRVMYDAKRLHYIKPETVDLARPVGMGGGDRITGFELPDKLGIELSRFLG